MLEQRMSTGTPDDVIFARDKATDEPVTWGQVRASSDEEFRLECLIRRLKSFLVDQYQGLLEKQVGPFPMAILTLTGIGSMGEIFYATPKPENAPDEQRVIFCRFCNTLD